MGLLGCIRVVGWLWIKLWPLLHIDLDDPDFKKATKAFCSLVLPFLEKQRCQLRWVCQTWEEFDCTFSWSLLSVYPVIHWCIFTWWSTWRCFCFLFSRSIFFTRLLIYCLCFCFFLIKTYNTNIQYPFNFLQSQFQTT